MSGSGEGAVGSVIASEVGTRDVGGTVGGATVVGARPFLIAYNINLDSDDVDLAKRIEAGVFAEERLADLNASGEISTLDPAEIKQKAGGGVSCSFETGN